MLDISSEPPAKRYLHLRKTLRFLQRRAKKLRTPFTILCYGSASYGFNPANAGKLDDLDLFFITPPGIALRELALEIERLFPGQLEMNADHVACLLSGDCDMCRLYSSVGGVKTGCRLLPYEVLREVSSPEGCERPVRNIASIGQSRIITDHEWSFALRRYEPVTYENYAQAVNGERLLAAHVVHQADGCESPRMLSGIWDMFIQISRSACPQISNDQIIDSIIRSEKFSPHFRSRLSQMIELSC